MYSIYNSDTLEILVNTVMICITEQLGMKIYLPVNLTIVIIDIYSGMDYTTML